MPQTSMQLPTETRRQIEILAQRWGLPETRNITPTIVQAIERVYQQEQGYTERERDMLTFLAYKMVATETDAIRVAVRRMAVDFGYSPGWQTNSDEDLPE